MICQIYSATSIKEALALIEAGVDFVGLNPTNITGSEGFISLEKAKEIMEAIGDRAKKVVIGLEDNPEEILNKARILMPDVLHISGSSFRATPDFVRGVKEINPFMKVMQAVQVIDETAIEEAKEYGKFVDYLILDTGSAPGKGIGASGMTHDWNISKKIVETCGIPVILAGGLSGENVAEAIKTVRPWGVDSMSKTDIILEDGSRIKDLDKVKAFCYNAKKTI